MKEIKKGSVYDSKHTKRFIKTLDFMNGLNLKSSNILNLGPTNPMTDLLVENGFKVTNTGSNQDLDLDFDIVKDEKFDTVIGFEILEHLVSPFPLLKAISAKKLVISVPLSLWFASAYWSETDPYDRHYHEFEPRQLKMLLDKSGWKIVKEEKHINGSFKLGIRPILRMVTPRHYFVYCERK